jgi:hypothetical protein
MGFSDRQLAWLAGMPEDAVRSARKKAGIIPTYRLVDTCAAEFEAYTPYYYSTYGEENETRPSTKRKVMILGAGDTSERTARSLVSRGVRTVIVANRTFERAAALSPLE